MRTPSFLRLFFLPIALIIPLLAGHAQVANAFDEKQLPLTSLQLYYFKAFLQRVKDDFVDPVDDEKLFEACRSGIKSQVLLDKSITYSENIAPLTDRKYLDACLKSILMQIDPHLRIYYKEDYSSILGTTRVGLKLEVKDGLIKVVDSIEGSPSNLAGIQIGDLLIKVGDVLTKGLPLTEVIRHLNGDVGSQVFLTISRNGEDKPMVYSLKRELINGDSVTSRLIESRFAYIKISNMDEGTVKSIVNQLENLFADRTIAGLIVDLRNNGGGSLNTVVNVAAVFLPEKNLVVSLKGRSSSATRNYYASPNDYLKYREQDFLKNSNPHFKTVPMVVLVNKETSHGGEIVAAALQDNNRAVLIGTNTNGGSNGIKTIFPIDMDVSFSLTTSRWFTPNGRSTSPNGIFPNFIIENQKPELQSNIDGDLQLNRALLFLKDKHKTN